MKIPTILFKHVSFLGTYKIGDKIKNLVCVNSSVRIPILSMRDTCINENSVPDIEDLEKNTVLPCSFRVIIKDKMLLQTPIKNYRRFITVPVGVRFNILL